MSGPSSAPPWPQRCDSAAGEAKNEAFQIKFPPPPDALRSLLLLMHSRLVLMIEGFAAAVAALHGLR